MILKFIVPPALLLLLTLIIFAEGTPAGAAQHNPWNQGCSGGGGGSGSQPPPPPEPTCGLYCKWETAEDENGEPYLDVSCAPAPLDENGTTTCESEGDCTVSCECTPGEVIAICQHT